MFEIDKEKHPDHRIDDWLIGFVVILNFKPNDG